MLGHVLKAQLQPQVVTTSTKFRDCLVDVALVEERISLPPTEDEKFRCSGVHNICPRMYALALRDQFSLGMSVDAKLGWIFGTGTAMHTQFQEHYLRRFPEGVFQGWWRDRSSGKVLRGDMVKDGGDPLAYSWIPAPEGKAGYEYVELEFYSSDYRLSGHCDGVLCWPDEDEPEILELKTINSFGFSYVDPSIGGKPKADHVIQANAYMWLTGLNRARIVYIKKDYTASPGESICEHVIYKDDKVIEGIKQTIDETIAALKSGEMPDKLSDCQRKTSPRAKYCSAKTQCFKKCS